MLYVKVLINRYVEHYQPGIVECSLIDAHGNEWLFIEKVPVVSNQDLDENSDYPLPGYIACTFLAERQDTDGSHVVHISTAEPDAIQATSGHDQFEVHAGQLIESD